MAMLNNQMVKSLESSGFAEECWSDYHVFSMFWEIKNSWRIHRHRLGYIQTTDLSIVMFGALPEGTKH